MSEFIDIDLDDIEDPFDPVPAGTPPCRINASALKGPGASGHKYIALELSPLAEELSSKKMWMNLSLSPKSLWVLKAFLAAVGVATTKLRIDEEFATSLVSKCIAPTVTVIPSTKYPGKMQNEVSQPFFAV